MATNGGCPPPNNDLTRENNGNGNQHNVHIVGNKVAPKPVVDLDEDLRKKVESLKIGDTKNQLFRAIGDPAADPSSQSKSYDDWKDELPIHLKSLKFMIGVLNDRHQSSGFVSIPENPDSAPKLQNMNILEDEGWEDGADQVTEMLFKKRPIRLPYYNQYSSFGGMGGGGGAGRRPRMVATTRNIPRRRTKSAGPDLSSYRNETPFGTRSYKHRDSDTALSSSSTAWFRKRRSIDFNGVHVVEEISEEDEDDLELDRILHHRKRIGSADGSPDSLSVEMELNLNSDSSLSSPMLKPVHRLRRDLWNISPISEDFSESDKEIEVAIGIRGGDEENANLDLSAVSSTNATFGDSCLVNSSRLSCSSPILAHSPSLRRTPVSNSSVLSSSTHVDTPPAAGIGSVSRRIRSIARCLDDISDKEEEPNTSTTTEESDTSSDQEEEKTESFEIDLCAAGDASSSSVNLDLLNTSLTMDVSSSSLNMETELTQEGEAKVADGDKITPPSTITTTVWETLSANIQAHMVIGNPAGFEEGVDQNQPKKS